MQGTPIKKCSTTAQPVALAIEVNPLTAPTPNIITTVLIPTIKAPATKVLKIFFRRQSPEALRDRLIPLAAVGFARSASGT